MLVRFWHVSSVPALYSCPRRPPSIAYQIYAFQEITLSPTPPRKSFVGNAYGLPYKYYKQRT